MTATLESRYGTPQVKKKRPSRFWYVFAIIACLVGVVLVAWIQFGKSDKPTARDTGFSLISDDEAKISFELVKNPEDTAVCAVKALNSARAPVGWKEVTIGPSSSAVTNQEVTLRTLSTATTVTVDSCWKR